MTFDKLKFSDVLPIIKESFVALKARFWLFTLPVVVMSIVMATAIYLSTKFINPDNEIFSLCLSLAVFVFVNLVIAVLLINNKLHQLVAGKIENYFQTIIYELSHANIHVLIVILSLIELIPSLLFSVVATQITDPQMLHLASALLQLIVFIFCALGVLALIISIKTQGACKPFHLLWFSLQFVLRNILVLIVLHLFIVIMIFIINLSFAAGMQVGTSYIIVFLMVCQFIINLVLMVLSVLIADNCVRVIR